MNKNVMILVVLSRAVLVTVLMGPRSHVIWNHISEAWTEMEFKHIGRQMAILLIIFYPFFGIDFPKASKLDVSLIESI